MTPLMSWVAIGLGLFVLWQVVKWWPGEVSEGVADESRSDLAGCRAQVGTPSLTSPFDWARDGFGDAA